MSHEEQVQKQKDMDEMLENYRAVKKFGKWAVLLLSFISALIYVILEIKRFFK